MFLKLLLVTLFSATYLFGVANINTATKDELMIKDMAMLGNKILDIDGDGAVVAKVNGYDEAESFSEGLANVKKMTNGVLWIKMAKL
ncbi:WG repeat-containing protein [Campylobacter majalis]|uniref:WG repeat-containing protein n=1 Tax=Campylobacter majalis TaxID=2790656 RepID=UPI003D69C4B0